MNRVIETVRRNNPDITKSDHFPAAVDEIVKQTDRKNRRQMLKYLCSVKELSGHFGDDFNRYKEYIHSHTLKNTDHLYNPDFLSVKFNKPLSWCVDYVQKLKSSKATNLDGFIARHGQEKGKLLFDEFVKTSQWKNSYIDQNGPEAYRTKIRRNNPRCLDYYIDRGYSEVEGKKLLREYQINNSGIFKEYWQSRGVPLEDIEGILDEIRRRQAQGTRESIKRQMSEDYDKFKRGRSNGLNINHYLTKYEDGELRFLERLKKAVANGPEFYNKKFGPELGPKMYRKRIDRYRKSVYSLKYLFDVNLVKHYYLEVERYTQKSLRRYGHLIGIENGYNSQIYNIDHIYSKKQGFLDKVPPRYIGHISNLRLITKKQNLQKTTKCDKTLEELFSDYNDFERCQREDNKDRKLPSQHHPFPGH